MEELLAVYVGYILPPKLESLLIIPSLSQCIVQSHGVGDLR